MNARRHRESRRPGRRLEARVAFGILLIVLVLAPGVAYADSISPHGGFQESTNKCQLCHGSHQAVGGEMLFKQDTEKALCYSCHDGTGASSDIRSDFGETTTGPAVASAHPVPDGMRCHECHTPHKGPAEGNMMSLRVGASEASTGTAVCGGCHGPGSTQPTGDMVSAISGTPHDTKVPLPKSGSQISCIACHEPHGSTNTDLVRETVVDEWGVTRTVDTSAGVNPLCLSCHSRGNRWFPGEQAWPQSKHASVASSTKAATVYPGSTGKTGDCANCHEPHGKPGNPQYTVASGNTLCLNCHDAAGVTYPAGYSYRGGVAYGTSAHDSIVSTVALSTLHDDSMGFAAWESTTPPTPSAPGTPIDRTRLDAMRYLDGQFGVTSLARETGEFDYQVYRFKPPATGADLKSVLFNWVGYGENVPSFNTTVAVWNTALGSSGGWETLSAGLFSEPTTVSVAVTPNVSHVTADGYMYFMASSRHAVKARILDGPYVSQATTTTALVTWTTLGKSTSWADVGPTVGYGATFGSDEMTTTHVVPISLADLGVYHFRIHTSDIEGITTTTTDQVFGTPSPVIVPLGAGPNRTVNNFRWSFNESLRAPYTFTLNLVNSAGTRSSYDTSLTSMTLTLPFDTYTWWVTAKDNGGIVSARSASETFVTYYYDPSCPILYTWNGSRWQFVTDVMGFGDLGIRQGAGFRYPPPVEDSVIPNGALQERDGSYELKLANEKPEIEFVDKVTLKAVDHAPGVNVYLNDYTRSGTTTITNPINIYTTRNERPVLSASYTDVPLYSGPGVTDTDITDDVTRTDGSYAPAYLFDDNQYTFDLGDLRGAAAIKLIVNGWTQYATPQERSAWEQSGAASPRRVLEVQDSAGNWIEVDPKLPFIPGYTKSVVYDLTGMFPADVTDFKVRMRGFYRTWIDSVKVDTSPNEPVTVTEISPAAASLGFKGISRYTENPVPQYSFGDIIDPAPGQHDGDFTKYGDVLPLLTDSDDRFVVTDSGDAMSLSFAAPPLASGLERSFIIHTDGYFQEITGRVDPMPFHAMSNWPYSSPEQYPTDATHTAYLAEWNTRTHPESGMQAAGPLTTLSRAFSSLLRALGFSSSGAAKQATQDTPRSVHTDSVWIETASTAATGTASSSCTACHDVHGQTDANGTMYPALLPGRQADGCGAAGLGGCHSSPANSADGANIYAQLTATSTANAHHDLTGAAQRASGAKLACSDCHNPHRETALTRYSDPDSIDATLGPVPADYVGPGGEVFALVGARHDGVAPTITTPTVSAANGATPTITWTTNEPATTWLDWGTTSAYELGSYGATSPLVTTHTVTPDVVNVGTLYHYRVRSADALGNERVTADGTVKVTLPPPVPDMSKPADASANAPVSVVMTCAPVISPDGDAAQYQFTWRNVNNPYVPAVTSPWVDSPSYTGGFGGATWAVKVRARDALDQYAVSQYSAETTFTVVDTTPPGTCPYLFVDDGNGMAFESDLYGSSKLAVKTSDGYQSPYPHDYYLLQNQPNETSASIDVRLVEERLEADYLDELGLYAVDVPAGRDVFAEMPQQAAGMPPYPGLQQVLHTVAPDAPAPLTATWVNTGEDVRSLIATSDGQMLQLNADRNDGFTYQTLELDLTAAASAPQTKLIIDGRTMFPDSPAGIARARTFAARTILEVQDGTGQWVSVVPSSGPLPKPAEFRRPFALDITNVWKSDSRKLRLTFLFKTYIDSIRVDTTADEPLTLTPSPLLSAELRAKGVDSVDATSSEFYKYVYGSASGLFEYFPGAYTRFGDVKALLGKTDDEFAIFGGGDEIAAQFGTGLPPAPGATRRWLVYANGYYKDMKSDATKTVDPLPFAGMSTYPYPGAEQYPTDAEHTAYRRTWNTRVYGSTDSTTPIVQFIPPQSSTGVPQNTVSLLDRIGAWFASAFRAVRAAILGEPRQPAPASPVASVTMRVAEPGPRHYSLNTDAASLVADRLNQAPLTYAAAAGWYASGATTPTPSTPGTLAGPEMLASITASDGAYWTTGDGLTDGSWNWQVTRYDLPQADIPKASSLRLVWDGYGEPTAGYPTRLALWNFRLGRWETQDRVGFGAPGELMTSRGAVPSAMCLRCHDGAPPAGVAVPSSVASISASWSSSFHGPTATSPGFGGGLIGEYKRGAAPDIPCATCHDPHGTDNLYHIPTAVKGKTGIVVRNGSELGNLCSACHTGGFSAWHKQCLDCHSTPIWNMDGSGYEHTTDTAWLDATRDCLICHTHGSRTTINTGIQYPTGHWQPTGVVQDDCYAACHGGSHGHAEHNYPKTF